MATNNAINANQTTPLTVTNGGTGAATHTAYAVLCGGTTSGGVLQSIAGVGTSGQVLTSNGAGALPTFQSGGGGSGFTTVVIQSFTASGTYTPTSGMAYCTVQCIGGGGAGGGCGASTSCGSGGGAGEYSMGVFSSTDIGASKAVTIGAGGAGVSGGTGGAGGASSLGALISSGGGSGGVNASSGQLGGAGGTGGSGGSYRYNGNVGFPGISQGAVNKAAGQGGSSVFGGGGAGAVVTTGAVGPTAGSAASGRGAGGGGAASNNSAGTRAGGAGSSGLILITEYIS